MGGKESGVGHKKSSGRPPPTDVPYLPMELWTGILIRTPAEALLKFKRVCKAWYELIGSRSFAESHVDHWTSRTIGRFVFNFHQSYSCPGCGCWTRGISYLVYAVYGNITQSRDNGCHCRYRELLTSRQRAELGCGSKELQVLASCDGLILMFYQVEGSAYQLLICNPLTGSYKKLAVLRTALGGLLGVYRFTVDYGWTMLRTASGRYKIFGMKISGWGWGSARRECYIFELQMGTEEQSEPRRKDLAVPLSPEWSITASSTEDGKVHWFATTQRDADHKQDCDIKVISLDILKEEFSASVSVKSRLCEPERPLFPSNGAFYHTVYRPNESSSLWVLENFDTMNWTEYGNFRPSNDPDFLYLSGELGDNKLFLGPYGVVHAFNLISKEFGRVGIENGGLLGTTKVLHTDSLIGWK